MGKLDVAKDSIIKEIIGSKEYSDYLLNVFGKHEKIKESISSLVGDSVNKGIIAGKFLQNFDDVKQISDVIGLNESFDNMVDNAISNNSDIFLSTIKKHIYVTHYGNQFKNDITLDDYIYELLELLLGSEVLIDCVNESTSIKMAFTAKFPEFSSLYDTLYNKLNKFNYGDINMDILMEIIKNINDDLRLVIESNIEKGKQSCAKGDISEQQLASIMRRSHDIIDLSSAYYVVGVNPLLHSVVK